MRHVKNVALGSLAGILFTISTACGGTYAVTPTVAPSPSISRTSQLSETGIAEALKYLNLLQDKRSAEDFIIRTYGTDGHRAVNLFRQAEENKSDIVSKSIQGNPYSLQELQQKLGTDNPYELDPLIEHIFEGVNVVKVDDNEMVGFKKAVDSYDEFKQETGFGTKDRPEIDPNLKALLAYTVIFTARSVHQDPLTAHKYAFAIAKDEQTREGVYAITYDIYFYGKSGVEKTIIKTQELGKDLQQKASNTVQESEKTIEQQSEKLKQAGEETKQKLDEGIKKTQQELQRQQEKAGQRADELRRQAEEEAKRKSDELKRRAIEESEKAKQKIGQDAEKAKEKLGDFLKKKK